jgi:hypothetical protein
MVYFITLSESWLAKQYDREAQTGKDLGIKPISNEAFAWGYNKQQRENSGQPASQPKYELCTPERKFRAPTPYQPVQVAKMSHSIVLTK